MLHLLGGSPLCYTFLVDLLCVTPSWCYVYMCYVVLCMYVIDLMCINVLIDLMCINVLIDLMCILYVCSRPNVYIVYELDLMCIHS